MQRDLFIDPETNKMEMYVRENDNDEWKREKSLIDSVLADNVYYESLPSSIPSRERNVSTEELDKGSLGEDIERVVTSTLQAPLRVASDFIARPIASAFDKEEEYDETAQEVFKALTPERAYDEALGRVKDPTTLVGQGLDIATWIVGGGAVFKGLNKLSATKKLGTVSKTVLSEQIAEQALVRDTSFNLANLAEEDSVIGYLAGDKDDSVLLNRAKMALTSSILVGGVTLGGKRLIDRYKKLGIDEMSVEYHAKQLFNRNVDELNEAELEQVNEALLKALRKKELKEPTPIITEVKKALGDDAEGVAQIMNQTKKPSGQPEGFQDFDYMSLLHRLKNRYFTSRGYFTKNAKQLQQDGVHRHRQITQQATHITRNLKQFMDDAIEASKNDDTLISRVSEALQDSNILKHSDQEKIKYITNTYKVNSELALEILNAKSLIDDLSKTILDLNIGSEVTQRIIADNMGSYLKRSYRLYEDANFKHDPNQFIKARDAIVERKAGSTAIEELNPTTLQKYKIEAEEELFKILNKDDKEAYESFISSIRPVNKGVLKEKKKIDVEVRKLMGEIDDSPIENILLTVQNLSQLTENYKFYRGLQELGGSAPKDAGLFSSALKEARKKLEAEDVDIDNIESGSNYVVDNNGKIAKKIEDENIIDQYNVKDNEILVSYKNSDGSKNLFTLDENSYTVVPKTDQVETVAKSIYIENGGTFTNVIDPKGNSLIGQKGVYIFDSAADMPKGKDGLATEAMEIFNTRIKGTNTNLDGKLTTPELARAIANMEDTHIIFGQAMKTMAPVQYFSALKGLNQQMRTVYDHTTQLRNGLGGLQFGLANGINPLKNGKLNFEILKQEVGNVATNKEFAKFYEKMQSLGVINTSVRLNEARALLGMIDETSAPAFFNKMSSRIKKYGNIEVSEGAAKAAEKVVKVPQDIYMATDDFFKMNAYVTELDWLKKAYPDIAKTKEGLEQLETIAANKVKNTMPNYDRVPQGIKALRELPVGNFVSFPAEIARTSMHIMKTSLEEVASGNAVLMQRGAMRFAGFATTNLGWFALGKEGYNALGFTEKENHALNVLAERPEYDDENHDKTFKMVDGELFTVSQRWINSYYDLVNPFARAYAEYAMGKLKAENIAKTMFNVAKTFFKSFLAPYTGGSMFYSTAQDIISALASEEGRSSNGQQLFPDKEIDTLFTQTSKKLFNDYAPGALLDLKKYGEAAFQVPNKTTGKTLSLAAKNLEYTTGVKFTKTDSVDNFNRHATNFFSKINFKITDPSVNYGTSSKDYANRYIKATQQKYSAHQEFRRYVLAMEDLGFTQVELINLLKEKGFEKHQIQSVVQGKFITDRISYNAISDLKKKATDKPELENTLEKIRIYQNFIKGTPLHPVIDKNATNEKWQIRKARFIQSVPDIDKAPAQIERQKFTTGGEVEVPNAPAEPDERIDKFTGLPYNMRAGTAYMDADDPLRRLGFMGGGTVDPLSRLGFGYGGRVKEFDGGTVKKALSAIANVRPKVEGFFFNKLFDDKAKANLGFSKDESIYEWVNNIGKDRYSKDSQIYGEQDAARHAALAWTSNQATYLKNTLNKELEKREKNDKYGGAMDLANNAIGAKLSAKNKAEAEQQIYKLIEENKLQYMNPEERKIANQKYLEDQYGVRVMEK